VASLGRDRDKLLVDLANLRLSLEHERWHGTQLIRERDTARAELIACGRTEKHFHLNTAAFSSSEFRKEWAEAIKPHMDSANACGPTEGELTKVRAENVRLNEVIDNAVSELASRRAEYSEMKANRDALVSRCADVQAELDTVKQWLAARVKERDEAIRQRHIAEKEAEYQRQLRQDTKGDAANASPPPSLASQLIDELRSGGPAAECLKAYLEAVLRSQATTRQ